jgi:hypothetical protein
MAEQEQEELTMKFRTVISSLALVSAMTFSGAVMAQVMIGGVAIPDANMASFQEKCAAIASAQTESLSTPVEDEAAAPDATATGSVAAGTPDSDDGDLASEDNLDQLLASLTPEQCKEAGLIDGPVPATTQ